MKTFSATKVDLSKLDEGMYISKTNRGIDTYDIRIMKPNGGQYLLNDAIHTYEHLFFVFAQTSKYADSVIHVGPMGCRTGFYLIVRDLSKADAIALVKESTVFIEAFEGKIPGRTPHECGNYIEHNLAGAKLIATKMAGILKNWDESKLNYPA